MSICMFLSHFNLIGHTEYGIMSLRRSGSQLILERLEAVADATFLILDVESYWKWIEYGDRDLT